MIRFLRSGYVRIGLLLIEPGLYSKYSAKDRKKMPSPHEDIMQHGERDTVGHEIIRCTVPKMERSLTQRGNPFPFSLCIFSCPSQYVMDLVVGSFGGRYLFGTTARILHITGPQANDRTTELFFTGDRTTVLGSLIIKLNDGSIVLEVKKQIYIFGSCMRHPLGL